MNVVLYLRVSTEEQGDSGLGIDAQRDALHAAAAARGWTITHAYIDVASGSHMKRDGLAAATQIARMTRASIVVSKLDRLTRSLLDFATLMEQGRREGWSVIALDLGVDTSTPAGEMMANVLATFAQFERRMISERTKSALGAKRRRGERLGRAPQIPRATRALIHALTIGGLGPCAIAAHLDNARVPTVGGKKWQQSTIRRVLRSSP